MSKIKSLISLLSLFAMMFILTTAFANAQVITAAAKAPETRPKDYTEVGQYAEVYQGQKNLQVTIIPLGAQEKKEALVVVSGIDHPWNKRVFLTNIWSTITARSGEDFVHKTIDYVTKVNGKEWYLLNRTSDGLQLNLRENGETGKEQHYNLSDSAELVKNSKP